MTSTVAEGVSENKCTGLRRCRAQAATQPAIKPPAVELATTPIGHFANNLAYHGILITDEY